jgi:7-keto-8-aminopelargonate synthetase-like enzyme
LLLRTDLGELRLTIVGEPHSDPLLGPGGRGWAYITGFERIPADEFEAAVRALGKAISG